MAVISTQRRHTVKPPPGAGVNWAHPLARGLVAAWLFNEGGGLPVAQSSIPLANPSLVAGIMEWERVAGIAGGSFTGTTALSYGDVDLVSGQQMSVIMSVRPATLNTFYGILNKRDAYNVQAAYSMGFCYNTSNQFDVNLGNVDVPGGGGGTGYRFSTSGWSTTRYQQITMTFDGTLGANAKILLWRDNVAQTRTATDIDSGGAIPNTTHAVEVGQCNNNAGRYFGGIEYIYIFNTALSPNEVAQLFLSPYAVMRPMPRRTWGAQAAAASTVKFRKTLSSLGTRTGSRQG